MSTGPEADHNNLIEQSGQQPTQNIYLEVARQYQLPQIRTIDIGSRFMNTFHIRQIPVHNLLDEEALEPSLLPEQTHPRIGRVLQTVSRAYLEALLQYPELKVAVSGGLLKRMPAEVLRAWPFGSDCRPVLQNFLPAEVWNQMGDEDLAYILCPEDVYIRAESSPYEAGQLVGKLRQFVIGFKAYIADHIKKVHGDDIKPRNPADIFPARAPKAEPVQTVINRPAPVRREVRGKKGRRAAAAESHAMQVFGALGTGDPQVGLIQREGFAAGIVGLMTVVENKEALNTLVADLIRLDSFINSHREELQDSVASVRLHIETIAGEGFTPLVAELLDFIDSMNIGGGINALAGYEESELIRLYSTILSSAHNEQLRLPPDIFTTLTLLSNMVQMAITRKRIR